MRSVNRIGHTRGNVKLGELPKKEQRAYFPNIWNKYNPTLSKFAAGPFPQLHNVLHQKLAKSQQKFESSPFNWYTGPDKVELLVITSGATTSCCTEAVKELKLEDKVGIFKLATTWPIPENLIEKQLSRSQRVLFVEEIDPFIERSVMELAVKLIVIKATDAAIKLGSPIFANVILIGALIGSGVLPLDKKSLEPILRENFPKEFEANIAAFNKGVELAGH